MALAAKVVLHVPSALATAVCVTPAQVTDTVRPASALPVRVTPALASAAETDPSPVTASMVGFAGAAVSKVTLTAAEATLALPARSVATAVTT